jgi:hypothetical protein
MLSAGFVTYLAVDLEVLVVPGRGKVHSRLLQALQVCQVADNSVSYQLMAQL